MGVVDGIGNLRSCPFHQTQLLLGKGTGLRMEEHQHPHHFAAEDERHGQHRTIMAGVGAVCPAWVIGGIAEDDRLAVLHHPTGQPLVAHHARRTAAWGNVALHAKCRPNHKFAARFINQQNQPFAGLNNPVDEFQRPHQHPVFVQTGRKFGGDAEQHEEPIALFAKGEGALRHPLIEFVV